MANWTIIFFIHEPNDRVDAFEDLKKLLESIKTEFTNLKIVLIIDELHDKSAAIYELSFIKGKYRIVITSKDDLGDMSDGANWQKAFDYILLNYNSEKYMLFTWGHAAMFGVRRQSLLTTSSKLKPVKNLNSKYSHSVFNDFIKYYKQLRKIENFENLSYNLPLKKFQKKFIKEKRGIIEMLWMGELADVINRSFKNSKIEVLLMMNCSTQTVENGYDLRNVVNTLIAPETNMNFLGYPYFTLFNYLNTKSPSLYSNFEFSKFLRDAYIEKYINEAHLLELNETSFFANDLSFYTLLFEKLEEYYIRLDFLLENDEDLLRIIITERNGSGKIPDLDYATISDLLKSLEVISQLTNDGQLKNLVNKIFEIIKKITSKNYFIGNKKKHQCPNGVSFLFPGQYIKNDIDIGAYYYFLNICQSEFVRTSTWSKIIERIMKYFEI